MRLGSDGQRRSGPVDSTGRRVGSANQGHIRDLVVQARMEAKQAQTNSYADTLRAQRRQREIGGTPGAPQPERQTYPYADTLRARSQNLEERREELSQRASMLRQQQHVDNKQKDDLDQDITRWLQDARQLQNMKLKSQEEAEQRDLNTLPKRSGTIKDHAPLIRMKGIEDMWLQYQEIQGKEEIASQRAGQGSSDETPSRDRESERNLSQRLKAQELSQAAKYVEMLTQRLKQKITEEMQMKTGRELTKQETEKILEITRRQVEEKISETKKDQQRQQELEEKISETKKDPTLSKQQKRQNVQEWLDRLTLSPKQQRALLRLQQQQ